MRSNQQTLPLTPMLTYYKGGNTKKFICKGENKDKNTISFNCLYYS